MRFLAGRYAMADVAWELWNGPNHDEFFIAPDPAVSYAQLVKAVSPEIRAVDADAVIVAGALSQSDHEFAARLYAQGIRGHFDAFSIHPYSDDRSPLDPQDKWIDVSFMYGAPAVRRVMLDHGDISPLWLTEFGWSTCSVRDQAPYENCVDEATQAQYLTEAYTHMRALGLRAGRNLVRDAGPDARRSGRPELQLRTHPRGRDAEARL